MDEPLKQRLVGAAVLALMAVVVIPLLLGEPEVPVDRAEKVPAVVPIPPPRPKPRPAPALPVAVVDQPVQTPSGAPATPAPGPASVTESGWVVQLATFSKEDNARTLKRQLSGLASTVTVERYGEYWRVVVGPFGSRASATKILSELEARTQLRGVLRKV